MSAWASVILTISLLYACVRLGLLLREYRQVTHLCWGLMSLIYVLASLGWLVDLFSPAPASFSIMQQMLEWLHITGVSLSLSVLALENWNDRPSIARYPFWLNFTPLLLLFSYLLVYDTIYLKNILAGIYEAGALSTGLLLFGLFSSRSLDYLYALIGLLLLLLGFVMYWFPGGPILELSWLWKLFVSAGIVSFVSGYVYAQTNRMIEQKKADAEFASSPSS